MREWVVGFLMDDAATRVVLIRKNRPEWQAGKLNGVGGKVEQDDHALHHSMQREFREEAALDTRRHDWHRFASLTWEEGIVHFFRAFLPMLALDNCWTKTDERVEVHPIRLLAEPPVRDDVVPNLLWLVPLAAHRHDTYDVIDVVETGTTLRKPGRLDVFGGGS